jgi:hypothetical protein
MQTRFEGIKMEEFRLVVLELYLEVTKVRSVFLLRICKAMLQKRTQVCYRYLSVYLYVQPL